VDVAHRGRHHGDPHARRHQRDVGEHLLDLGHDPRGEAGAVAGLDQVAVHARGARAAHEDEALAREVAQAHARAPAPARLLRQAVRRREGDEQAVVGELVVGERALLRHGRADERGVEAPGRHRLGEGGRVALVDLQRDAGMGFAVAADEQRREAVRHGGAGEADGERAGGALGGLRAARHAARHGREHGARLLGEHGAALRELHAARQPAEEGVAQLALEVAHLLRQRRLLHAEGGGRAREVAVLGHGEEVAQVPEFHGPLRLPYVWNMDRSVPGYFTA